MIYVPLKLNQGCNAMAFERCVYFNTNALARKLNARWEKAFAPTGLSPSLGYFLRLVLNSPGLSQQEIAGRLQLDKSTVARFADQLATKGLIERMYAEDNAKEKRIFPTPAGKAMERQLEEIGDALYALMQDAFGASEIKGFVASLREASIAL